MLDNTQEQAVAMSETDNGSNMPVRKLTLKQVTASAKVLGSAEGKGSNSRPGLFMVVAEAAKHRAVGKDDVPAIYQAYALSAAEARGVGYKPQDSETQQRAKLGVAVRLGELPHVDAMILLGKIKAFQDEERMANDGKMDYSPFDGIVKVSRYQVNKSPTTMLDDDVIRGLLMKPAKDDVIEADRLEKIQRAIDGTLKINSEEGVDKEELSEVSRDMLTRMSGELADRIAELGGSTKDKKRDAKARAELLELADLAAAARAKLVVEGHN